MLVFVIFGAPGTGKGTQSAKLIDKYNLAHISTGDVLRAELKAETELGLTAGKYMNQGLLIPDELMIDILLSVLDKKTEEGTYNGIILDGFPRTIPQGEALNAALSKRNTKVEAVIDLEVPEQELVKRLLNRGKETGRADDNREVIENRLNVYFAQTSPLKDFYKQEGILHEIDGLGTVDQIFDRITSVLDTIV